MKRDYYAEFYAALARRVAPHEKTADVGRVIQAIAEPPASLMSALGHGLAGAGEGAAAVTKALPQFDPLTRGLAAIPGALRGGASAFHRAGGLRAAALTGLGGLGVYGAKRLIDDAREPSPPAGYYAPGGY